MTWGKIRISWKNIQYTHDRSLVSEIVGSLPVQSMNCVKLFVAELLGEYEDDGVVPVPTAGVHGNTGWFVHHQPVLIIVYDGDLLIGNG